MRCFCLAHTFTGLPLLLGLFLSAPVAAYPLRGMHRDVTQPDGSQVPVLLWGDEFYIRAETPNGYTLILDPDTKFVTYAIETPDGNLVSSGVVYDGVMTDADLARAGIVAGARHSNTLRHAISAERRAQLNPSVGAISVRESSGTTQFNVVALAAVPPATKGTSTGLVVLVDFPDRKSTVSITEVENAFNTLDVYGTTWHGSIRNWSEQISGGITSVQHKVVGFYTAKYDVAHYNAPTVEWDYSTADELYKEIYAYIDANYDLTGYAINGTLPSLAVAYAGDIIARDWAMALWPHGGCGGNRYRTSEGVTISQCLMTNLGTRTPLDLETFRHELGHSFFHWPDTYDYDDDSKSAGGFATETDMPCAPFRMWAGWITPYDVTSTPGVYSLEANGASFLRYNNASNKSEYFIAEYAKKSTRRTPPDQGLLIWHIDENGDNSYQDMTATRHYMMSVEQADGKFDLEHNIRAGTGDLFRAGYKDKFDDTTTPNSKWWNGSSSGFKVCNIGDITADTMSVNAGCVTTGGTSSAGGATSTGGTAATTGGTRASGGVTSAGGRTAAGGAKTTGGSTSAGGTSGVGGTKAAGGSASTGGYSSTGGASTAIGTKATGGLVSTGGRSTFTSPGGAKATGGVVSTAGSSSTGGTATLGTISTGGTPTTGGLSGSAVGGSSSISSIGGGSSGGSSTNAMNNTGGRTSPTPGGASSMTTSSTEPTDGSQQDSGGCSCRTAGQPRAAGWASLAILSLFALRGRRRRGTR
jgi:M6 family metalloprotease-like protein/MYXO-CTERM domain-containing protein